MRMLTFSSRGPGGTREANFTPSGVERAFAEIEARDSGVPGAGQVASAVSY